MSPEHSQLGKSVPYHCFWLFTDKNFGLLGSWDPEIVLCLCPCEGELHRAVALRGGREVQGKQEATSLRLRTPGSKTPSNLGLGRGSSPKAKGAQQPREGGKTVPSGVECILPRAPWLWVDQLLADYSLPLYLEGNVLFCGS